MGVAFDLPAPPTLMIPLPLSDRTTKPIFWIRFDSPEGAVSTSPPAVVEETKRLELRVKREVSSPPRFPKVMISTSAVSLASAKTNPKAGIVEDEFA